MKIAIVTDTTCDLTAEECERYNASMVSLSIEADGKTYLDQIDISSEGFYELMRTASETPKTAQPKPVDFLNHYAKLAEEGYEAVVSIHLAECLSGTISSARLAAQSSPIPVTCVDSHTAVAPMGLLVIEACQLRDAGKSVEEIVAHVERRQSAGTDFLVCENLDNLFKGGRLKEEDVATMNALNIKPVLLFDEIGALRPCGKVKGMHGARNMFVEKLKEATEKSGKQRVRLSHANSPKGLEKLRAALQESGVEYEDYGDCLCGAIVAAHLGEGCMGIAFIPEEGAIE